MIWEELPQKTPGVAAPGAPSLTWSLSVYKIKKNLTLVHNGTLLKSFRKQPQTNNLTFHSDSHETWVNTSDQFLVLCNNLFLRGESVPKPKTEDNTVVSTLKSEKISAIWRKFTLCLF